MQTLIGRSLLALAALSGCDDGKTASAPPAGRVVAIAPAADEGDTLCDPRPAGSAPPPLSLPPLADGAQPSMRGPLWVNLWATWCPPCVEELPLVRQLEAELKQAGSAARVQLVSVDATADAVQSFAAKHPEAQGSLRVADVGALEPWLPTIGLDTGATLPIHLFVDAHGKVACTRTGAIRASDLPRIRKLLTP